MTVHKTALVHKGAKLGNVNIGPYAIVEEGVQLEDGVEIGAHAIVRSGTRIGAGTRLGSHVVLGGAPQDRRHDASVETTLEIGEHNVFRSFSTAHRGSSGGEGVTRIGSNNLFMVSSHVAHDCQVGSHTIFANCASIAGHVRVGDGAVLGGLCAVHQRCRIGRLSMIGGGAMCAQHVPPFSIAQGDRARLFGVNIRGIHGEHGLPAESIALVKEAWRLLFASDLPRAIAISRAESQAKDNAEVAEMIEFLRTSSDRGVCRPGIQV